ncbi:MAG: DUF3696 domain-containing protein [Chloroflexaceae bacterium]|nr:DUF3696 domain-containing protein [Chloroflexaceae bacterium]
MITELHLTNFKCFENQIIALKHLTLLSGLNGMGKSTVIQALLLLRQSYERDGRISRLELNGELTSLGTAQDVRFEHAQTDDMSIGLLDDHVGKVVWRFCINPSTDVLSIQHQPEQDHHSIAQMSLFQRHFQYLQAERIGPRNAFETSDFQVRQRRQLGPQGAYTAHFLALFGNDDIALRKLQHPDAASLSLKHQVEAWLNIISPGTRLNITSVPDMDIVGLRYSFTSGRSESNPYRTTNVGFGLTYTLPILVALLSSPPGALLLLENPEAHLHPKGQSLIGELLARAAAAGQQIIVETHSDHILNGIRVAVRQQQIPPQQVALHFFERDAQTGKHLVLTPQIDHHGRINEWPDYFFDQYERSLEALLLPVTDNEF